MLVGICTFVYRSMWDQVQSVFQFILDVFSGVEVTAQATHQSLSSSEAEL